MEPDCLSVSSDIVKELMRIHVISINGIQLFI